MKISIGIAGIIVVAMMLATMPTASAGEAFTWCGNVTYSTTGEWVPDGWTVQMMNLNHSEFAGQPWTRTTQLYVMWNAYDDGEMVDENDYIYVNVTSPDGLWYGEFTSRMADIEERWFGKYIRHITVYEVEQPTENFTKSLVSGWNLISLPLTPLDNSASAVLSGVSQDAVKQYDATTKTFADATTMDPGTGYFVHVTTAGDWVYEGTPETSTSPGLTAGLNMIGVPNCTMDVSAAMGTADYRYVARWNAVDQKFEVYNPNAPAAFHHFTTMTPGEGYFVSAKSDDGAFTISCSS